MKSIILCEGRTDAILLSYYLGKVYGWSYSKKGPEDYAIIKVDQNQEVNWYKKDNDYLLIFGVGGKDNFKKVIDNYVSQILQNYPQENSFDNIVIVADKDSAEMSEIENLHTEWLRPYVEQVVNSKWLEKSFEDNFGNTHEIHTLSIIIPADKQGASETTLLDAISEEEYDKIIVEKCEEFVEDVRIVASKYIKTDRLALKARLATVFAVLSPEKVFSQLDAVIKEVPWERSQILMDCFEALKELSSTGKNSKL